MLSVDEAGGEETGAAPSLAFVLWDEALEKTEPGACDPLCKLHTERGPVEPTE